MLKIISVKKKSILVDNGIELEIPCKGEIWSYMELIDRVIVLLFMFDTKHCNQFRNIFCYSKEDGRLLWQIEQPYDRRNRQPLEEVYKYIKLQVFRDGKYVYAHESVRHDSGVLGKIYLNPFRRGLDRLSTMTLSRFPNEYWIDIDTGEVEWYAIHQKI